MGSLLDEAVKLAVRMVRPLKFALPVVAWSFFLHAQNTAPGISQAQTVTVGSSAAGAASPANGSAQGASPTKTNPPSTGGDSPAPASVQPNSSQQNTQPTAPSLCRSVSLGMQGQRAPALEKALNAVSNVSVKAVGDSDLMVCSSSAANLDVFEALARQLTGLPVDDTEHNSHVVRLFYRTAPEIATAINNSGGLGSPVKSVGNDILVFSSESRADDRAIAEYRRWIAQIDVPRPQLSINVWSIQISSKDTGAIQRRSIEVRQSVDLLNQGLQSALQQGWRYLERYRSYASMVNNLSNSPAEPQANLSNGYFDPLLTSYLQNRFYMLNNAANRSQLPSASCYFNYADGIHKADNSYCLGYTRLFSPIQPSLTSLLIGLIATTDSKRSSQAFVDCMEARGNCYANFAALRATNSATSSGESGAQLCGFPCFNSNDAETKSQSAANEDYPGSFTASNQFAYGRVNAQTWVSNTTVVMLAGKVKNCLNTIRQYLKNRQAVQSNEKSKNTQLQLTTLLAQIDIAIDAISPNLDKPSWQHASAAVRSALVSTSAEWTITKSNLTYALDLLDRAIPAAAALNQDKYRNILSFIEECKEEEAIQALQEALRDSISSTAGIEDTDAIKSLRTALIFLQAYPDMSTTAGFYRQFVQRVSTPSNGKTRSLADQDCEQDDKNWLASFPDDGPSFACFRKQLLTSVGENRSKALTRMALADFLFNYKTSKQYPQDFLPGNLSMSAQTLDNLFNPLVVEFNRDLGVYLRFLQFKISEDRKSANKIDYLADGLVTVRVVSGTEASVDTTTQSAFPMPPSLSVKDFVKNLASGNADTGKSSILTANLTPIVGQALVAAINAEHDTTVRVGRNLNLVVTANTLNGGSSAELDVKLDSAESGKPTVVEHGAADTDDTISRVAVHNTSTKVRVDSLKLFEISSFSATLQHGRTIPIVPPLLELPYVGSLLRLHLPPGTVFHRSFAILSAVMVPTAADIADSIAYLPDQDSGPLPRATVSFFSEPETGSSIPLSQQSPSGAATVVQIQSPPAYGSGSISVNVGCCSAQQPKAKSPASPPPVSGSPQSDQTTDTQDKKNCQDAYYWVVTHYREGKALSGPFKAQYQSRPSAAASAKPAKLPKPASTVDSSKASCQPDVTLLWVAPSDAVSFDLYRASEKTGTKVCIASGLEDRAFKDNSAASAPDPTCPRFPSEEELTVYYSDLNRLPRNILSFHRETLTCLAEEADPTISLGCLRPKIGEKHAVQSFF